MHSSYKSIKMRIKVTVNEFCIDRTDGVRRLPLRPRFPHRPLRLFTTRKHADESTSATTARAPNANESNAMIDRSRMTSWW